MRFTKGVFNDLVKCSVWEKVAIKMFIIRDMQQIRVFQSTNFAKFLCSAVTAIKEVFYQPSKTPQTFC